MVIVKALTTVLIWKECDESGCAFPYCVYIWPRTHLKTCILLSFSHASGKC